MNFTVYMGSHSGKNKAYAIEAKKLGEYIGENGHTLCWGGSNVGLMGVVSDNVIKNGGKVIGVFPKNLEGIESKHPYFKDNSDKLIITEDILERKQKMIEIGDVFVALPGGPGTIEEISEIMSLARIDQLEGVCILLNIDGYFDDFKNQYKKMLKEDFIEEKEINRIHFLKNVSELSEFLSELDKS